MKWTRVASQCSLLAILGLTLVLQACSQSAASGALDLIPATAWPAFPVERGASVNVPMSQNGAAAIDTSANAAPSGNNLILPGSSGLVEYGLFQFSTNGDPLVNISVAKAPPPSSSYYLGLANYDTLRWEVQGPFSSTTKQVTLSGANYTSPGNNLYAFVAVFGGANVTLQTVTLTVDSSLPTFSISGQVTENAAPLGAVTMNLTGAATASTQTDGQGNYSFSGLIDGSYTLTPSKATYTFAPPATTTNVAGGNVTGVNFSGTAAAGSFSISGFVTETDGFTPIPGTTLTLTPGGQQVTSGAGPGAYTFTGIAAGNYTITPTKATFTFNPTSLPVTVGPDATGKDFEGSQAAQTTYETGAGLIKALVNARCSPCHTSQNDGSVNFSTWANVNLQSPSFPAQKVYERMVIRGFDQANMPVGGMPQGERDKLKAWRDDGFLQ